MDFITLGKLLPGFVLPHAHEIAEKAGYKQLSRILEDGKLPVILEKLGDVLEARTRASSEGTERDAGSDRPRPRGKRDAGGRSKDDIDDLDAIRRLRERLLRLEEEHTLQQKTLAYIREQVRPLSAALGSCSECLVGVALCATCGGKGQIGAYEPNLALLQSAIVEPLAARGVTLPLHSFDEPEVKWTTQRTSQHRKEQGHVRSHVGK